MIFVKYYKQQCNSERKK